MSSERTQLAPSMTQRRPGRIAPVRTAVRAFGALVSVLALAGLVLAAGCLLVMLVYTTASVLGRYTGWWSLLGADELGAYAMAGVFFFGLAYAFRSGAFIAVSPFRKRIPPRLLPAVEVAQLSISLFYVLVILKYVWDDTYQAWDFNVTSVGVLAWPNWIPMAVMPIGCGVLSLQIFSLILERIFLGTPAPSGGAEHPLESGAAE
jgi:TRAP-type C4-dicarboxylate transport system permease small subunit